MNNEDVRAEWQETKDGWQKVADWAIDQVKIDGDTVQVEEILAEWQKELLAALNKQISKQVAAKKMNLGSGTLTLDEYELHDWQLSLADYEGYRVQRIEIEAKHLSDDEVAILEAAYAEVIKAVCSFDSLLHDVAEYTC